MSATGDSVFEGSVPLLYDTYLVPMIFEPYAEDLVRRLSSRRPRQVLELACGTGVVTRRLASALPAATTLVATDLNPAMLDVAAGRGADRPVEWRVADAMSLPFADGAFDAVVCQFGVMFFPDKGQAFAEVHRVLRAGGVFLFNVWDGVDENEFAGAVTTALAAVFPADPPRFFARTPHGYADRDTIAHDLTRGGFAAPPDMDTMAARSIAPSAQVAAMAYCQGTPLRGEIEARDASRLGEATSAAAAAIAERFSVAGGGVQGRTRATVIAVTRKASASPAG